MDKNVLLSKMTELLIDMSKNIGYTNYSENKMLKLINALYIVMEEQEKEKYNKSTIAIKDKVFKLCVCKDNTDSRNYFVWKAYSTKDKGDKRSVIYIGATPYFAKEKIMAWLDKQK
ncbi:MAG: hypothetical protein KKC80_08755 [Candidatus Margulisbacteria bacterium]|nr:hypothetical protein [Candidatus Margulisiibacteriota bacterium]MBU1235145.1 hypothetical protein [Pseudomonadota bacterium]MBU1456992.1 hypothetical protein [Pseudomonadota bacterium]